MQKLSAHEHLRALQKIKTFSQVLDCAGLSSKDLIQKCNELQALYDAHQQLISEVNEKAADYQKQSGLLRQQYQLLSKKLKAIQVATTLKK